MVTLRPRSSRAPTILRLTSRSDGAEREEQSTAGLGASGSSSCSDLNKATTDGLDILSLEAQFRS
jgi:hypothetical protein